MSLLLLLVGVPAKIPYKGTGGRGYHSATMAYVSREDDAVKKLIIRNRILNEDREIMELVAIIVKSGMLQ